METATINPTKPSDTKKSSDLANSGANLKDLLSSSQLGARVRGIVLSVDEPRTYSGSNTDGSKYVSISRRIQLFAGPDAGTVICGERVANIEDFQALEVGSMLDAPILGAKTEGKQMIFRIKL